jgi:hypothetical protein
MALGHIQELWTRGNHDIAFPWSDGFVHAVWFTADEQFQKPGRG